MKSDRKNRSRNDPPRDGPKRKRDPLPPVIKVKDYAKSFPLQLGEALVHQQGDPIAYGGKEEHVRQALIEARAAINTALRLMR